MSTSHSLIGQYNFQVSKGITGNRNLLSCDATGNVVDLWTHDDESGRQKWFIESIPGIDNHYHIRVFGGVDSHKKYLSCSSDGSKVDLFHEDDGSGRQRWIIEPIGSSETLHQIRISGGVSSNRKFLSCGEDGKLVDLWDKDDQSGRQKWEFKRIAGNKAFTNPRKIALKASNGKFVCAENNGADPIIANRDQIGPWETFDYVPLGGNKFALRACNGKFVQNAENGSKALVAAATHIGPWETFWWAKTGGSLGIYTSNNKFVHNSENGSAPLISNQDQLQENEKFELINLAPGKQISIFSDTLISTQFLESGQQLESTNKLWKLLMQNDGNLVIYDHAERPIWATNTSGKGGERVIMQDDGNLVIYKSNEAVWASNTSGKGESKLLLQNDGNLVIYQIGGGPIWSTNTNQSQKTISECLVNKFKNNGRSAWMGDHYEILKGKKLAELTLPGTHDSGTDNLQDIIAPDATGLIKNLWENFQAGGATGIASYIKGMAKCQSISIKHQLLLGIRYIDFRVCKHTDNKLYTCHSLLGSRIDSILDDLNEFLQKNQKEIVVLKVGFKGKNQEEFIKNAKTLFRNKLGNLYQFYNDVHSLKEEKIESLIEQNKRALFISDNLFYSNYSGDSTTNQEVIQGLKDLPNRGSKSKFIEAQLFRPVSDKNYVLGYIQSNGCKAMGILPKMMPLPLLGPILAGMGIVGLPAIVNYLNNFDPVATNLLDNARNSRSIIKDYLHWLKNQPEDQKPSMMICDFFQEVPMVEVAIKMSLNEPYADLVVGLEDQSLKTSDLLPTQIIKCGADGIAAIFKLAGYGVEEAGKAIDELIPGLPGDIIGETLKGVGYTTQEVVDFTETTIKTFADTTKKAITTVFSGW